MEKIRIKLKAYDHTLLDRSAQEIVNALKETGAKVSGPIPLPTRRSLYTVLRSTFVHKKSREQFELTVHKRLVEVIDPTKQTTEALTRFDLPAGVDVEIKT